MTTHRVIPTSCLYVGDVVGDYTVVGVKLRDDGRVDVRIQCAGIVRKVTMRVLEAVHVTSKDIARIEAVFERSFAALGPEWTADGARRIRNQFLRAARRRDAHSGQCRR